MKDPYYVVKSGQVVEVDFVPFIERFATMACLPDGIGRADRVEPEGIIDDESGWRGWSWRFGRWMPGPHFETRAEGSYWLFTKALIAYHSDPEAPQLYKTRKAAEAALRELEEDA
ncbi:MAG: hypothetical protein ACYCVW_16595 [Rhodocyclaceae bacterium]